MSPSYELIFSFSQHPVLGVFPEAYLITKLDNGSLSLTFQKIGEANASDFIPDISSVDKKILKGLERLNYTFLARIIQIPPKQFEEHFTKLQKATDLKSKALLEHLKSKISDVKLQFFNQINAHHRLFEMSKDGYPAGRELCFDPLTHLYFSYDFQGQFFYLQPELSKSGLNGQFITILDEYTPVVLVGNTFIRTHDHLKVSRLRQFNQKTRAEVSRTYLKNYARSFIIPDLASELAVLKGSFIFQEEGLSKTDLYFSFHFDGVQTTLFENTKPDLKLPEKLQISLGFWYGNKCFPLEKPEDHFQFEEGQHPIFTRYKRSAQAEQKSKEELERWLGISLNKGTAHVTFEQLKDLILPKLEQLPKSVSLRFSPEFKNLRLDKAQIHYKIFEKIDFFEIEGSIDWDDQSIDLADLRDQFELEGGWLKRNGQYWRLSKADAGFLQELFILSKGKSNLTISKTTAKALQLEKARLFSEHWQLLVSQLDSGKDPDTPDIQSLSPHFKLREYQLKGVEWLISLAQFQVGGILADDMGLGKTIQTAAFLNYRITIEKQAEPTLIVMPSTLLFNWLHELNRFSGDFYVYVHSGTSRKKNFTQFTLGHTIILVSYQTLVRDIELFEKQPFSTLIIDEAHTVKNPGTVSYQALASIKASRVYALTGTPIQNSPADLWALSELCNPGLLNEKIKPQGFARIDNQEQYLSRLRLLQQLVQPFVLRRKKEHVLGELPEKTISTVYCAMPKEQEKLYLSTHQNLTKEIKEEEAISKGRQGIQMIKALTVLRQLANHPRLLGEVELNASGKFDVVTEKLLEVLDEGHKVLIFSSFVKHLKIFEAYLKEQKIEFCMLTGGTRQKEEVVQSFRSDEKKKVFLISLKTGGFGLNLVEANYVFLLDPWWNPAAEFQAMDRVYRIGQKNKVTVLKFITSNTVEEKILQLQERKQGIVNQFFSDQEMVQEKLSIELLKEILETRF